ncbi:thiamine ABC transporter substrate binding subunit [Aurantimonas sp. MSK8Z-1]|uniref:thiamine ABC transporter substrate binding subunit n=1 Tax=Mangrovibrevibacter kandeliae TaxID=2968473 RepID=UPI002118306F|nr:thiamine ABC transporter substrate binding subunit [Aurantimonas sp. MSK8Z-1]MCW4113423.1 thiamine ABC transporter substrate binding subunit [Aurantimonas sp. MSK8Z-1]
MRRPTHTATLGLALALPILAGATAQAQEKPVLTVYTYESFTADWGPGPEVKQGFEATCGCTLRFVGLEDGVAILNRLKLEGASTDADVVLGLDTSLLAEAKATGLFAESGVDMAPVSVPGGYSDPVFVPFDYGWFAVVYDSEVVKTPPTSLEALVSGDPGQKIAIEDPRTSTPGLGLLLWMKAVYGDDAAAKWKQLSGRILTVTPGWSEAYGLLTSGEAPMVLSYTTSPAYHLIEESSDRYKAAAFSEGHYIQVEVAARTAKSDQPDLASRFLTYLVSTDVQDVLPTTNWMMPAAKTDKPLPDAFGTLVKPVKTLMLDPQAVADHRRAWTDEWLQALGR